MTTDAEHLCALNQRIRTATLESNYSTALQLDSERRQFLDAVKNPSDKLRMAVREAQEDCLQLVADLEMALRAEQRGRREARNALHSYRRNSDSAEIRW